MSVLSRPVWGRPVGSLGILTAKAGRCGTLPAGAGAPVRGQAGGADGEADGLADADALALVFFEQAVASRAATAIRAVRRSAAPVRTRKRTKSSSLGGSPGSLPRRPVPRQSPPIPGSIIGCMAAGPILVVEDEHNIASLLKLYLENEGFSVAWVADGAKAVDEAERLRPALVVLDVMLPGLDGLEVCRRLRARGRTPIIMLTARDSEVDRVVGLELGADDYVTKPFSPRELVARVKA